MNLLRYLVIIGSTLVSFAVHASAPTNVAEIVQRETGGSIMTLFKNTKQVYYINAQSTIDEATVKESLTALSEFIRTPINYAVGSFMFSNPEIKGELSLYIIDDATLPMSLIAPEGRWAFVNVSPLKSGRGAKPAFFKARVKKEMARIGCMLLGGIGSTYRGNLLAPMCSPEDLDQFASDALPVDGMMRCETYLKQLGVKPFKRVSYRRACQEGWAPAPTNDIQKAVWDKVHAMPSAPLTIKPETTKVEK